MKQERGGYARKGSSLKVRTVACTKGRVIDRPGDKRACVQCEHPLTSLSQGLPLPASPAPSPSLFLSLPCPLLLPHRVLSEPARGRLAWAGAGWFEAGGGGGQARQPRRGRSLRFTGVGLRAPESPPAPTRPGRRARLPWHEPNPGPPARHGHAAGRCSKQGRAAPAMKQNP